VPGQRGGELGPAERVLVLELDPGRAGRVPLGDRGRAAGFERGRDGLGFGPERGLPVRRRPVACAGRHRGQHPVRVPEHQVQRGETAHGQADQVGRRDAQTVQHGHRVGHRARL
jgi:hypothetical protein